MSAKPNGNNLVKKLTQVLQEASKVNKSGWNNHQKYHYITEADLLDAIRPKLTELGIFIFSSVEESTTERIEGSKQPVLTSVRTKHTFVDGESGEEFSVFSCGQGVDNGDKGVFKAITGANKYFLLKTFMLSGDDDPENDGVSAKPSSRGGLGSSKTKTSGSTKKSSGGSFSGSKTKSETKTEAPKEAAKTSSFSKKSENSEDNVSRPSFRSKPAATGTDGASVPSDDDDVGF